MGKQIIIVTIEKGGREMESNRKTQGKMCKIRVKKYLKDTV